MKKLLSLVLALALALPLSVTAFATGEGNTSGDTGTGTTTQNTTINYGDNDQTGKTTVNYSVAPAYTVTIPEKVTLGGDAVTVKAEGVKVAKGQQVVVKLTGINVTQSNADGDNEFKVTTDEGAALKYTVKNASGNAISKDGIVLTVNPASTTSTAVASGSAQLTFALNDTVQYAGEYTGTVTFTVSVDDVTTNGTTENP